MLKKSLPLATLLTLASLTAAAPAASTTIDELQQSFTQPPMSARPMVRFWLFGPSITKDGIARELTAVKAGGFGGIEFQPTYPLAVDGGSGDTAIKNVKFMSPEFLDLIHFTAAKAKELGLRMDLTLGSGWPYGGPMFSAAEGAGRIETQAVNAKAGDTSVPFPELRPGRTVIAAFAGPAGSPGAAGAGGGGGGRGNRGGGNADASALKPITIANNAAQLPPNFAGGQVLFFISGRTGMQVKRPAFGAEGNVIDHLSASVVQKFIAEIGEPEIQACAENPPTAIFCDSLEVAGENFTDDFLAEFQKRRGYDLTPFLPALIGTIGDRTDDIRHDFGQTVTDLYNDNFNAQFKALAHKYNSKFRVQGYGSPPAGLLSFAFSDLPEGELAGSITFHNFRATRYAASAAHLMNVPVTSAETFTWLHAAPFRATPLDMKGEVDTQFLDGVNQIICHGWPTTSNGGAYPGWSFYAAAVFNDKNPWYIAMPDVTTYIARNSQLLREGTPVADVALYLPDSDVWSKANTGFSSLNAAFTGDGAELGAILTAGFNTDAFDDGMLALKGKVDAGTLAFGDLKYKIVVLPAITDMPLATARNLDEFTKGGGTVIALRTPSHVPGYKATDADQKELAAIMQRIFSANGHGLLVENASQLTDVLKKSFTPDVAISPASQTIGFVHRHTDAGEIYFLSNASNQPASVNVSFRINTVTAGLHPVALNALDGTMSSLPFHFSVNDGTTTVPLKFEPYGAALIFWTKAAESLSPPPVAAAPLDLSSDWDLTFASSPGGEGKPVHMDKLTSWTDLPNMKNYSGVATYQKKFTATADMTKQPLALSFGPSKPSAPAGAGNGFTAQLSPPVLDVAVVSLNGERIGSAWCPPYTVDLTGHLKEGENTLSIQVANTAVNYLSKAGFPNYDLAAIRAVYKNRFDPQGMQHYAQPLPSGLTGPITIIPQPTP